MHLLKSLSVETIAKYWLIGLSFWVLVGCSDSNSSAPSVLRLAVTTSTRDSGVLEQIIPEFERRHQARIDVIAVGTGAALKLGMTGDVDAVLVHSRKAENEFMQAGYGSRREDVMYNSFVLVGPDEDLAGVRGLDPIQAFKQIAKHQASFLSRGDESGTHLRELQLWADGGGRPEWDGYQQSGQGMGASLIMADEMQAYLLCDQGTFLKLKDRVDLEVLVAGADMLRNPYGVLVVDPDRHESVNGILAEMFVNYLVSDETQAVIRDYRVNGEPLFFPRQGMKVRGG